MTLIEIVLALGITAIVMSLVYTSLRTAGRSLNSLSVRNELYRSSYALLEEIGRELSSAYLSPNGNPLNGTAITYFFVENKGTDEMPQDSLYFTTLGHARSPIQGGESDQSEVCYSAWNSEKKNELVLLKKEDPTLDDVTCRDETQPVSDLPYAEVPIPVATGIHPDRGVGYRLVGFQVDCFRSNDEDDEPLVSWDSEKDRRLPNRVKVTLIYEDTAKQRLSFSKTSLLRLMEWSMYPVVPSSPPEASEGGPIPKNKDAPKRDTSKRPTPPDDDTEL